MIPGILRFWNHSFLGLKTRVMIVGVIETRTVDLNWLCAQNRVVEHALHAVAVADVPCERQKIAHHLEMRVSAAWCLKTSVRFTQTCTQQALIRLYKSLVGAPSAGRETLTFPDHLDRIQNRPEVLLVAQFQIALHPGTQRIHVAVGMQSGQNIFSL